MKTNKLLATIATLITSLVPAAASADVGDTIHKHGMTVSAGGGPILMDAGELEGLGGGWEARVGFGTKKRLAIELAYVGAYQRMLADSAIVGTSVESNLRVNLLVGHVRPYLFAGVGWARYSFRDPPDHSDDVAVFPMGGGLALHLGQFMLDLGAFYRKTAASDNMAYSWSSIGATLRAGFEY